MLKKAAQALKPGGGLLLEPHTFEIVKEIGENGASWYTSKGGLFSDAPHLMLTEHFWDEETGTTTVRHFVIDADSAEVTRQETINGGTIWLATYPGEGQSRFYIHPDGHLATWTWLNLGPLEVDDRPADSGSVEYTTSDVAPTVTLPAIGSPFDLSQFNVPEDFPIGR